MLYTKGHSFDGHCPSLLLSTGVFLPNVLVKRSVGPYRCIQIFDLGVRILLVILFYQILYKNHVRISVYLIDACIYSFSFLFHIIVFILFWNGLQVFLYIFLVTATRQQKQEAQSIADEQYELSNDVESCSVSPIPRCPVCQ